MAQQEQLVSERLELQESKVLQAHKVQLELFPHPTLEMFGHLLVMDQQPLGHLQEIQVAV
jgi:hypothetical protein